MSDYALGSTIYWTFTTRAFATGVPTALAGSPTLEIYENDSATPIVEGAAKLVLTQNLNSINGFNLATITATSGNGFEVGKTYHIIVKTGTVGGTSVVGEVVGRFTLEAGAALRPTTAGRTLDVSATGEAGVDWANVGSPTTTLALTGTTIATTQKVDVETIKTNPVVNAGTITFPTTATLASTTNITAGVITTTTNLTNERGKYQHGAVWIDTVNGAAGTTAYTNGIATNPSASIANAKDIADNLKLKRFWIQSGSSVTMAAAYVGYVFTGAGYVLALGGQDISKAIIENAETLSGTGICTTGEAIIRNCHLGPTAITIGEVDFQDCHLMGTVTMSQASVPYLFNKCVGVSAAKIVFSAANQSAVISKWSGPLTIAGMVSTNTLYLDGDGSVVFDNTNNAGVVHISGAIKLTDSGASMNITDSSRWGEDQTIAVATTVAANGITATSIAADAINAASVKAAALNGKGDWNVGKTGYALTQTFPANFSDLKIAVTTGIVDSNIQKINDVTITGDGQSGTEFGV